MRGFKVSKQQAWKTTEQMVLDLPQKQAEGWGVDRKTSQRIKIELIKTVDKVVIRF